MKQLLMSDIHGNITALEAVLEDALGKYDEVLLLGDYIDYGVSNIEVLEKLEDLSNKVPMKAILGNHEEYFLKGDNSYYIPKKDYSIYSASLTKNILPYLRMISFIKKIGININSESLSLGNNNYAIHSEERLEKFYHFSYCGRGRITVNFLVGHNHLQYDRYIDKNKKLRFRYINPGSVGQPRNGDPRACYAIIEYDDSGILRKVEFYKVSYDINKEVSKMDRSHPFIRNRIKIGI